MASAEFDDESDEKRPTVQVGDPFAEKLLIEATLELMASGAVAAIQDMGAAGLTSSSVEMAGKGGVGIELDLDAVPQREEGMTAYEMMLSESQERMLVILKPGREAEAEAIFEKWGLDFAVIGRTTDTGHMIVKHKGKVVADLPVPVLADSAPLYERPWIPSRRSAADPAASGCRRRRASSARSKTLMGSPDARSQRWIWEQYDRKVMGDTIGRPGADAGIVRVHGTKKALAVDLRRHAALCRRRSREGGKQAVVETLAQPDRGRRRPDRHHRQHELRQSRAARDHGPVRRLPSGAWPRPAACSTSRSCRATSRSTTRPTASASRRPRPSAASACMPDVARIADIALKREGDLLVVIGREQGWLGQSLYQQRSASKLEGAPPPVDLADEIKAGGLIRALIREGKVVSRARPLGRRAAVGRRRDGARRQTLASSFSPTRSKLPAHAIWFGEDQGRYRRRHRSRAAPRKCWSAPACWHFPPASSAASAATLWC